MEIHMNFLLPLTLFCGHMTLFCGQVAPDCTTAVPEDWIPWAQVLTGLLTVVASILGIRVLPNSVILGKQKVG